MKLLVILNIVLLVLFVALVAGFLVYASKELRKIEIEAKECTTNSENEHIICAAIHYDNGLRYNFHDTYGIDTGFVLAGYRHPHICSVLPENPYYLKRLFNEVNKEVIQKYEELKVKYGWQEEGLTRCKCVQGFLTSKGRFVDRKEAWKIARAAGQIDDNGGCERELFSEDLY